MSLSRLWLEEFENPLACRTGRVVTRLPLTELWDDAGKLRALRVREVGSREINELLRTWSAHFLVAEVGRCLQWVDPAERYSFWKSELKPHLVEPSHQTTHVGQFPGHYCYMASEWQSQLGEILVVMEKFH